MLAELEAHRDRSGDLVDVLPFVTGTALQAHYAAADGVILASRHDGWGLTIHEGLRGVPVIASDACGAAELITRSNCGMVVPAGDTVALADAMCWWSRLSDADRSILGENGRALSRTITVSALVDQLISYCHGWQGRPIDPWRVSS